MFFYQSDIFYFHSFGCTLGSHPGHWVKKLGIVKTLCNSSKRWLGLFLLATLFPFRAFACSLGAYPRWISLDDNSIIGLFVGRSYRSEGDVVARSPPNHTQLLLEANAFLLEGDIPSPIQILPKVDQIEDLYTINPFVIFAIPNDSFESRVKNGRPCWTFVATMKSWWDSIKCT